MGGWVRGWIMEGRVVSCRPDWSPACTDAQPASGWLGCWQVLGARSATAGASHLVLLHGSLHISCRHTPVV